LTDTGTGHKPPFFVFLKATLGLKLKAENQEELATKERKKSQKKQKISLLYVFFAFFCGQCLFWPGLAGMREFRAAASLFLFFEGLTSLD
jgi:hypothetical protein